MTEKSPKKFNWNFVALGILFIAYIASAGRFLYIQHTLGSRNLDTKIVRVAHWQLEPGYREALDAAINAYNALPDVQAANVKVVQAPITERVYTQFMNVHLISGTAPDIAVTGKSNLVQGSSVARFFTALSDYVNTPNKYNGMEFTSPELDADVREYLATAPWKDTFLDGMEGGWNEQLNDYYAVPVSNYGKLRLFYNMDLLKKIKKELTMEIAQANQPAWMQDMWLREENGETRAT